MSSVLNLAELVEEQKKRINFDELPERIYAQQLTVPFSPTVSGGRALIAQHQYEQMIQLAESEVPQISGGWENKYSDKSSSTLETDEAYYILDKICKFEKCPNQRYYLIVQKIPSGVIDVIDRKEAEHITMAYGYRYNNTILDSLEPGFEVDKGTVIKKSTSVDEYMNRKLGVNLLTTYICNDYNTEDAAIISKDAAIKASVNLFPKVSIVKNANDIFLNMLGDNDNYKSFADVTEYVKDGILLVSRKSITDESPYMQSNERLRTIMTGDDKITLGVGDYKVVDIDIYVNNPIRLANGHYNKQLVYYYEESIRFAKEFVKSMSQYADTCKLSYTAQYLYDYYKKIINGKEFIKDNKKFSDVMIEFYLYRKKPLEAGDKIADRYGGKGVVSIVLPNELMPKTSDGRTIDIIKNPLTMHNRENGGQCYEISINSLSDKIIRMLKSGTMDSEDMYEYLIGYIRAVSPVQANYIDSIFSSHNSFEDKLLIDEMKDEYVQSVIDSGRIELILRSIRDHITIDELSDLIDAYVEDNEEYLTVSIRNSNGDIRYTKSRRKTTVGKAYTYPMKQYGEEKFSVTSMSSTNIRNENSRNKANNNYKALHSSTPIKIGDMEAEDLDHIGPEAVIKYLMVVSLSPILRRTAKKFLTEDPYNTYLTVSPEGVNRSVEQVNAYLKALGLRLKFTKTKKTYTHAITYHEDRKIPAIEIVDQEKYTQSKKDYYKVLNALGIKHDAIIFREGDK